MNTVASYPQTWFSNNVDPRLINSDSSWNTFSNPWPANDSTWTPAIDAANHFFLPYGQDVFLSGPPSPTLPSFERTDTPILGTLYEPTSHSLPLQGIFQGVLPETQHSLSPHEEGSTSQFLPLQNIFQGNLPWAQQSNSPSTESYNRRQIVTGPTQVPSSRKTVIESHIESGNEILYDGLSSAPRRNPPAIQFTHKSLSTLSSYTSYLLPPKSLEAKKCHQRRQQCNTLTASLKPEFSPDRVQPSPSLPIPPCPSTSKILSTQFTTHASARGTKRKGPTIHETNSNPDRGYIIILDAGGRKMYQCKACPDICTYHKGDMNRHRESLKHKAPSHQCTLCPKVFSRPDALKRHLEDLHLEGVRRPKLKHKSEPKVEGSAVIRPIKRSKTSGPF